MQKWEYQTLAIYLTGEVFLYSASGTEKSKCRKGGELLELQMRLEEYGQKGWELVNFAHWGNFGTNLSAVFKRPLP